MIVVTSRSIDGLQRYIERFGKSATTAAQLAVNDTADWSRSRLKAQMQAEVNLSETAFNRGQLRVTQRARPDRLEAIVSGAREPYSLSRFKQGEPGFGPKADAVRVRVATRGKTLTLKRAFYVKAPNGAVGIGVRSKVPLDNSRAARRIKGTNVFILFGPSPYQLAKRMMPESAEAVGDYMTREFNRQLVRLTSG